jgi:hypothetical protein
VLLGATGAVAAVDTPILVRTLHAAGCRVRIALTRSARRFVSTEALSAITHEKTYRGLWDRDAEVPVPHVGLAEWAELVLIAPASAASLARMASGDARDLVSALVLATRAPVVIAPSMNDAMWSSPGVRRNLEVLRSDGRYLIHPAFGVEVAHEPARRRPLVGPAPPAGAIVEVVRSILAELVPALPQGADGWDPLYRSREPLPWTTDRLDDDFAAALDDASTAGARRLVDLGAGTGSLALEAARRGFQVVATDVSPTALDLGRRRAADLSVAWVIDDVTRSTLWGTFDVACDRGLLHCLGRAAWPAYASTVARLVAPGGRLLLKVHERTQAVACGTVPPDPHEVGELFSPAFAIRAQAASSLPGPGAHAPSAVMYVLERTTP